MKYLSICSGIEAASVAWEPLGWEPVAFAEIEAFPSAVLAHHWPHVPNMGDMTKFREWDLPWEDIDVLVGGTPCQSWSVAGKREGKADPRGILTFTFLEMIREKRPKWVVWENVPGILSDKDNALVEFLDAILDSGYILNADILDAQFFGVAQRRRRIFLACQRADILITEKTNTSLTTGAIIVLAILQDILAVLRAGFESGQGDWGLKWENARDGLRRKISPFLTLKEEALKNWLDNLEDTLLNVPRELKSSEWETASSSISAADLTDCGEDMLLSDLDPKGQTKEGTESFTNTLMSSRGVLADLFAEVSAFTTSMGTKPITVTKIFSFVNLSQIIARFMFHSKNCSPNYSRAASLSLTTLTESINYARQSTEDLFSEAWVPGRWIDFLREADELCKALASSGTCGIDPAEILLEREGVQRHSPPSRETGQGTAGGSPEGPRKRGSHWDGGVHPAVSQSHNTDGIGMSNQELFSQGGARLVPSVVPIQEVDAREKHQNGESGFAVPVSPTVGPLTTHHTPHGHGCAGVNNQEAFSGHLIPVAFGGNNLSGPINVSPALNAHPSASGRCDFESEAFLVHGYSIDKEHSDATGPLLKDSPTGGGRPLPAVVIPFDTTQITSDKNYSSPKSGEPCHPLASGAHPPAIAFCNTGGDTNLGLSEDGGQTAPPITTRNGDPGCVAFAQNTRDEVRLIGGDGQIAGALASETGMKQQSYVAQPIAIRGRGEGRDLELGTEGIANAILTPNCGRDGDPIQGGGGKPGQGDQSVRSNMAVRRLTPVECEVLQGFPRFHSLIQWRGKSAEECPDGPRYKALGNSMAVPVMAWIGSRIDLVAKRTGYGQPMNPVHHTPPTHEKRRRTQRKK